MSEGWTVIRYLELASIIECATAIEGTNFETSRLMPILEARGFEIRVESLKKMIERNKCFGRRGPQKLRGCPLKEGERCSFIPFSTWSRK